MYERIHDLRKDYGFSQKDMANQLNIGQSTYSDYELGKLNIPISILIALAKLYGTSIDYLLELTDDPRPYERKKR